jgi:hypothetical protein
MPTFHPPALTETGAPNVEPLQSSRVTPVMRGGSCVVSTVVVKRCSMPANAPAGVAHRAAGGGLLSVSARTCSDAAKRRQGAGGQQHDETQARARRATRERPDDIEAPWNCTDRSLRTVAVAIWRVERGKLPAIY